MILGLLACWSDPVRVEPGDSGATHAGDTAADADTDTDSDADADADGDTDTDADADADTTDPGAAVCERWNADRADLTEATWSGNAGSCDAGDMDAAGRARALTVLNLYRYLAGLPEVVDDRAADAVSQECALMMHANDTLSHTPPTSWRCYTADGAAAAGTSNIASGPAVMAMDMYMQDWGNDTTLGHRRWILSNTLGPVGIGSTSRYSCLQVIGGRGNAGVTWQAWPPPGAFPFQAVAAGGYETLDQTGWTIQSDTVDLGRARVAVTDAGAAKAMDVTVLDAYYGSTYAISMVPQGWTSQAGHVYHVELSNVSTPIAYDVEMVDCGR
jgi:hypothetical protein